MATYDIIRDAGLCGGRLAPIRSFTTWARAVSHLARLSSLAPVYGDAVRSADYGRGELTIQHPGGSTVLYYIVVRG